MTIDRQFLVNLTRSSYRERLRRLLLVQWTRSGLIFILAFYKNSIRDRDYCSTIFGRSISDNVKLSSADDMGVWFIGLNVCNFRRILLSVFHDSNKVLQFVEECLVEDPAAEVKALLVYEE